MARCLYGAMLLLTFGLSGCLWDELRGIHSNEIKVPKDLPPATQAASSRAYSVFSALLAANPDIVVQLSPTGNANYHPPLQVVGVPGVAIFHRTGQLFITEGLVTRCKVEDKHDGELAYDRELAAVLSSELAKMVVEADAQQTIRGPSEADRPFNPRVTGDNRYPDQTDVATMGIAEKDNLQRRAPRLAVNSDPNLLARNYLGKANLSPDELNKVSGLIRQAQNPSEIERQLNPPRNGIPGNQKQ